MVAGAMIHPLFKAVSCQVVMFLGRTRWVWLVSQAIFEGRTSI